ncbi:hypothetical protein [Enterococcus sp. AZ126]|uniref:hypothetical protein n=1 Tax=Enterococcus sp. AZ126 TaxID=2774635 RepID=UPI003F1ED4A9
MIKNLEEFWTKIDEIRIRKNITWKVLFGGNGSLAANKTLNPTLKSILSMQEILGVSLINILPDETFENSGLIKKDPKAREKMDLIYRLTKNPEWMTNQRIVEQVQEIGKTIV